MMKIMMTAAFALAATTAPALAQTTGQTGSMAGTGSMASGSMQAGAPQQDSMSNSPVNPGAPTPTMSKSQMASMKRCQSSATAMKSKKCMKMQQMHPDMGSTSNM